MSEKLSSYKGYYGLLKGIVVKGKDEDPLQLGRIQVRIPSYHGSKTMTNSNGEISLPWAQICTPILRNSGLLGGLFSGLSKPTPITPEVGDTVWLMFEGGDIRYPIYMGALAKEAIDAAGDKELYVTGGNIATIATEIVVENVTSSTTTKTTSSETRSKAMMRAAEPDKSESSDIYSNVIWDDEGATSIGIFKWRQNNARNLLKSIRDENTSDFNDILESEKATGLRSDLDGIFSNWDKYKFGEYSPKGKALKSILSKPYSKSVQDRQAQKDVMGYIDQAKQLGIHDPAVLIYFCDIYNENPSIAMKVGKEAASNGATLDKIHQLSISNGSLGRDPDRRSNTYNRVKTLKDNGDLTPIGGDVTILPTSVSVDGKFPFPVPGYYNITSPFGMRYHPITGKYKNHNGIDIAKYGINGKPAIAVADSTVTIASNGSTGYGNTVYLETTIDGNKYGFRYGHLSKINVQKGQHVTTGMVVGLVGSTGDSTGPHLHFEIKVNGSPIDPLPHLSKG